jgi:hypothetical protein
MSFIRAASRAWRLQRIVNPCGSIAFLDNDKIIGRFGDNDKNIGRVRCFSGAAQGERPHALTFRCVDFNKFSYGAIMSRRNFSSDAKSGTMLPVEDDSVASPTFKNRWLMAIPAFGTHMCIGMFVPKRVLIF